METHNLCHWNVKSYLPQITIYIFTKPSLTSMPFNSPEADIPLITLRFILALFLLQIMVYSLVKPWEISFLKLTEVKVNVVSVILVKMF